MASPQPAELDQDSADFCGHDLGIFGNAHGNGGSGVIHFLEHAALTLALRGAHHLGARHGSWNQSASSRPSEAVFVSIHVALNHVTHYRYDRPVSLSPQIVRLRPAPHCRTRILAYSLKVRPSGHFINWQQDPQANYLARLVFPDETREFKIEVDLVAEMSVLNPFDFFLAPHAQNVPFKYESSERRELAPYLVKCAAIRRCSSSISARFPASGCAPSISSSLSTGASPATSAI